MKKDSSNQGFTLVELMVTLAVVAIVISIAAPSFSQMIRDHRLITAANDFMGTLQLARSESIRRGVQVTLLPIDANNWNSGWDVFTDWNRSELRNQAAGNTCAQNQSCFLVQQAALTNGVTIGTGGTLNNGIRFFPTGEMASVNNLLVNDTFTFCISGSNRRLITLNTQGSSRVRIGNVCP